MQMGYLVRLAITIKPKTRAVQNSISVALAAHLVIATQSATTQDGKSASMVGG